MTPTPGKFTPRLFFDGSCGDWTPAQGSPARCAETFAGVPCKLPLGHKGWHNSRPNDPIHIEWKSSTVHEGNTLRPRTAGYVVYEFLLTILLLAVALLCG